MANIDSKWFAVSSRVALGKTPSNDKFSEALLSGEVMPDTVREWLTTPEGQKWVRHNIQFKTDRKKRGIHGLRRIFLFEVLRSEVMNHLDEHGKLKRGFLPRLFIRYAQNDETEMAVRNMYYAERKRLFDGATAHLNQLIKAGSDTEKALAIVAKEYSLHLELEARQLLEEGC